MSEGIPSCQQLIDENTQRPIISRNIMALVERSGSINGGKREQREGRKEGGRERRERERERERPCLR